MEIAAETETRRIGRELGKEVAAGWDCASHLRKQRTPTNDVWREKFMQVQPDFVLDGAFGTRAWK